MAGSGGGAARGAGRGGRSGRARSASALPSGVCGAASSARADLWGGPFDPVAASSPPPAPHVAIADEPTSLPDVAAPALPPTTPAVPFHPNTVAVAPVVTAPKQQSGETREVDASELQARVAALGIVFNSGPPRPPTPSPFPAPTFVAPPPANQPTSSAPPAAKALPSLTQEVDPVSLRASLMARGIPFPEDPPAPRPTQDSAPVRHVFSPPNVSDSSGTAETDTSWARGPALPFSGPSPSAPLAAPISTPAPAGPVSASPALPLTPARFAEIQAALARSADRDGVLRHFGLDAPRWHIIVRHFDEAMRLHPSLRTLYETLFREAMSR